MQIPRGKYACKSCAVQITPGNHDLDITDHMDEDLFILKYQYVVFTWGSDLSAVWNTNMRTIPPFHTSSRELTSETESHHPSSLAFGRALHASHFPYYINRFLLSFLAPGAAFIPCSI